MSISENQRYVLGCDIGNGYGYISLLSDPKADPMPLFPNNYKLSNMGMPTTAYIVPPDGNEIEVFSNGKPAEERYRGKPKQLVGAIKTRFKDGRITVDGIAKPVEVSRIYSAITRDLLLLAEEELTNKSIPHIYDVVFTFPAKFSDNVVWLNTMQQSIESLEIEGKKINVLGRLPEPAAVAIDYLHYMQNIAPEEIRIKDNQFTVLVYDLGHGTFDTAVVTARSDEKIPYKLHFKDGLPEVGGKDFDKILYDEILSQLQEKYAFVPKNDNTRNKIRKKAVEAKFALTDNESFTASIVNNDGDSYDIDITRERFEELSWHLLSQTLELAQGFLDDAAANGIKIDGIVLSGGASRMPMVKRKLEELVDGEYPVVLYRPSEAVSYGAARFAYGISKNIDDDPEDENNVMKQMTDCCYGIWCPSDGKLKGEVKFLVPCGKSRPASSETVPFYSKSSRMTVRLYRSKEKNKVIDVAAPDDCDKIFRITFDVIPRVIYDISVTVLENYDIQVNLRSDKGGNYQKTTADELGKLV